MSNNKFIDLAKKLKALADQGVGGEKSNALNKLKSLMLKHGISMEDIEGESLNEYIFRVTTARRRLFVQIVFSVLPKGAKISHRGKAKNTIIFKCTVNHFVEIKLKSDFYWEAYKDELDLFERAFIQKHSLYAPSDDTDKKPDVPLTLEERRRLARLFAMAEGMKDRQFHKALHGKLLS